MYLLTGIGFQAVLATDDAPTSLQGTEAILYKVHAKAFVGSSDASSAATIPCGFFEELSIYGG